MSACTTASGRRFAERHIGTDAAAQRAMLEALGYDSRRRARGGRGAGSRSTSRPRRRLDIPPAATEREALAELRALAVAEHACARSMIGLGYYDTITPVGDPAQRAREPALVHRLHAVPARDLAGPPRGAHQLPDDGHRPHRARRRRTRRCSTRRTAVVEGMLLARRASKSASNVFVVDADALPQTKALLRAPRRGRRHRARRRSTSTHGADARRPRRCSASFVQYPGASGRVWDPAGVIDAASRRRAASPSSPPTCSR